MEFSFSSSLKREREKLERELRKYSLKRDGGVGGRRGDGRGGTPDMEGAESREMVDTEPEDGLFLIGLPQVGMNDGREHRISQY